MGAHLPMKKPVTFRLSFRCRDGLTECLKIKTTISELTRTYWRYGSRNRTAMIEEAVEHLLERLRRELQLAIENDAEKTPIYARNPRKRKSNGKR